MLYKYFNYKITGKMFAINCCGLNVMKNAEKVRLKNANILIVLVASSHSKNVLNTFNVFMM